MINYNQLKLEDLKTIIAFKFNEDIHIHTKDLAELRIENLNSDNHLIPFSINPINDRESALAFYATNTMSMSDLNVIIHRLYISGADLYLQKIKEDHYTILVQYSKTFTFKKGEQSIKFYETIDDIDSLDKLDQIYSYLDKNHICDNTTKNSVDNRISLKYIDLYLNSTTDHSKWQGKIFRGKNKSIEIDIQNKELVVTFNNIQYTATIDKGLKFKDQDLPQTLTDLIDKSILIREIGDACKNLLHDYPYAPITTFA